MRGLAILALVMSVFFGGRFSPSARHCFTAPVRIAAQLVRNEAGEVVRIEWRAPRPGEKSFVACAHERNGKTKAAVPISFPFVAVVPLGLAPGSPGVVTVVTVPESRAGASSGPRAPDTPPPSSSDQSA